jgi:hypothetical protein
MKKLIKSSVCFILIIFLTGCESQYLGGDRNAKWKKDLNYLEAALPQKHANLFFKTSEENFKKEIEDLKKSVETLNDDEVVDNIYEIIASIGDTHTSVYKQALSIYPIQFYYFRDGIYVINTISRYERILYTKLTKINGIDIEKVENTLLPLIAVDNEAMIKKTIPKYLMNPEILHGTRIVPDTEKAVFTFENEKGEANDLVISSVNRDTFKDKFIISEYDNSYPLYMQDRKLNYWYKYLDAEKTVYFKYNRCLSQGDSSRLEDFISELLKFMDSHPVDKFIIDIRDNSGGSDRYMGPVIDWLQGKEINNKNKLFVITGRATFSSAIINAVMLRKETNATFVGEATSGKPNHYGSVSSFQLPNSKITIQYSTQYNKVSEGDNSNTFMPDRIIEVSSKDYSNKKDPVLDYILGF